MNESEDRIACDVNPATPDDLDWIFRQEIDAYTARYAVARQTLERWYGVNPNGFFVLTMNGRKIGHVTFVPLRPKMLEGFVLGTMREQDIQADCLFTPAEKHLIRNLYVESIMIDSATGPSPLPIKALTCLAHNFVPLVRRVCEPASLDNLYALAASGRGERLMKGLGFSQVKSSQERPDQRALYVARFSALAINISELYDRRLKMKARAVARVAPARS